MITFLPGQIASAADVNANFDEITATFAALGTGARIQRNSGTQTIPAGLVPTQVTFDTVAWDTSGYGIQNALRVPGGMAGRYLISAGLQYDLGGATGRREMTINRNGTPFQFIIGAACDYWGNTLTTIATLADGETLSLTTAHNANGTCELWSSGRCFLAIAKIGG